MERARDPQVGVELVDVHKRYGATPALRGLTLRAGPGEVVGLVGPNGAGKTTTLRVLAALARPDSGRVRVCGYEVRSQPDRVRACVGFLPEQAGVYGRLSAVEILRYFGALWGLPPAEVERRTRQLVDWLGMGEFCHRPSATYSRGMRQRLQLARALLHDPPVLLLDEPTAGLDTATAQAVWEALRVLAKQGRCALVATHSAAEARRLCHRVVVLEAGTVREELSWEDLQRWELASPGQGAP